jgi:hypothetical protein
MNLSREQQSLDSFFNSFDNEKNAYNLKLFFKIIFEFCQNLNKEKTLVTRTLDKKIAIEFQGFEIIRISNFTLQLLILNENNQEQILKSLDKSDTKEHLSPKGTTLYNTSFELLSLHGNDIASLVKLSIFYLKNFEKSTDQAKTIYQDINKFLDIDKTPKTIVQKLENQDEVTDIILPQSEINIEKLLTSEENEILEFKGSLFWEEENSTNISKNVLIKEIAGFFNSQGGQLVYGVSDSLELLGISNDLAKVNNSVDKLELRVRDILEFAIGKALTSRVKINFSDIENKTLMILTAPPSPVPVFANLYFEICKKHKDSGGPCIFCINQKVSVNSGKTTQGFFVRNGNRINMLNFGEMYEYSKIHWPEFNRD